MNRLSSILASILCKASPRRWAGFFAVFIGGMLALPGQAQHVPEVSLPIVVSTDAGGGQTLTVGYDPQATNERFDQSAPPPPPSDAFDARIKNDLGNTTRSLLGDIREGKTGFDGTETYEVEFQTRNEATSVTIAWDLPEGITGTIEDVFGSEYGPKDMAGEGSITISPDAPNASVTLEYSGSQAPINIYPTFVGKDGVFRFRHTGVDIEFSGVGTADTVTLTKFKDAPNGTDGITESNVSSYRYVVESGDLSLNSATLRFVDSTLAGINDPSAVQVYRRARPGAGTFSPVSTNISGDGTKVVATTNSFSEFVLASDSEALPVELVRFTATQDEQTAVLRWRTASETNNAGFEVQHKGPNTNGTQTVGTLGSKAEGGTTTTPKTYRFEVTDLMPGTHRFRLRQVDVDGSTHRAGSVVMTIRMTQALRLFPPRPNPARTRTHLRFGVRSPADATVRLYNVLGQRVATLYAGTPPAEEMQTLRVGTQTLGQLPSGVYFVRLTAGGKTRTRRLTIAR